MDLIVSDIDSCIKDWFDLADEYKSLEANHKKYITKLEELCNLQQKCTNDIKHQQYRLGLVKTAMKKAKAQNDEDKEKIDCLKKDILRREAQLNEMKEVLPKPNGFYLRIILGSVNVSILNRADKFKYKDEYEKFKLVLSAIAMVLSVINLVTSYRVLDLSFMFLAVWYYCTLTIRESILKVNGSHIKGWWRAHHFISTVLAGILLTWPDSATYHQFRKQLMWFYVYISFVQYLQFKYQQGCLYRLKTLGKRHDMDITIEGFHSWMWRGLSFLLPFLYVGYLFELYNAWGLYQLSFHPEAVWQVPVLAVVFLILFLGNTITTSLVIPQKIRDRVNLKYRFTPLDKYFWSHSKRSRLTSTSFSGRSTPHLSEQEERSSSRQEPEQDYTPQHSEAPDHLRQRKVHLDETPLIEQAQGYEDKLNSDDTPCLVNEQIPA